jgi:hypothetical protein
MLSSRAERRRWHEWENRKRMTSIAGLVRRVRSVIPGRQAPVLDPRLTTMERVFRAPPLSPELIAAIKLISPHFDAGLGNRQRELWEADQNGACWGEWEALGSLLHRLKPQRVLEIGPGIGRSLVFFSKKLQWEDVDVHAYDGNGTSTKYTLNGPRFTDSFCSNIHVLKEVLAFNGVKNVKVFDAAEVSLPSLPGPYDLIYSFYSIGFHWALEYFLDDILALLHERSVAVFTLSNRFVPFPALDALCRKTIEFDAVWPKGLRSKLLVLSKSDLPDEDMAAKLRVIKPG